MRASPSTCRALTIDWQVCGLCRCLWCARGLCLCPCVIAPRGCTSLPTQEAEYSFSGCIPTNKQTNKQSLVQWLGWVFENKERKKQRKSFATCQDVLGYAIRYDPIPRDIFLGPMWLIGCSPFVESSDWRVFYTREWKKECVAFHKKTVWCNTVKVTFAYGIPLKKWSNRSVAEDACSKM